MTEYPTLTALMANREPGSVKVRLPSWGESSWIRPCRHLDSGQWSTIEQNGLVHFCDDGGPWLIVDDMPSSKAEDPPALDTLRLEIAAKVLAAIHIAKEVELPAALREDCDGCGSWDKRHAYALAEADALLAEARRTPSAEAGK